jgi:hypothetical protein
MSLEPEGWEIFAARIQAELDRESPPVTPVKSTVLERSSLSNQQDLGDDPVAKEATPPPAEVGEGTTREKSKGILVGGPAPVKGEFFQNHNRDFCSFT